jgi:hypothetical protein
MPTSCRLAFELTGPLDGAGTAARPPPRCCSATRNLRAAFVHHNLSEPVQIIDAPGQPCPGRTSSWSSLDTNEPVKQRLARFSRCRTTGCAPSSRLRRRCCAFALVPAGTPARALRLHQPPHPAGRLVHADPAQGAVRALCEPGRCRTRCPRWRPIAATWNGSGNRTARLRSQAWRDAFAGLQEPTTARRRCRPPPRAARRCSRLEPAAGR